MSRVHGPALTRRRLLQSAPLLLGLPLLPGAGCEAPPTYGARAPVPAELADIVDRIENAPRDRLFADVVAASGRSPTLLARALLASTSRNFLAQPMGFDFHAAMIVPALQKVAARRPEGDDGLRALLFGVDVQRRFLAAAPRPGLPVVDDGALPPQGDAPVLLLDAVAAHDVEAADAAAAALARSAAIGDIERVVLVPASARFRYLGHHAVHPAAALGMLRAIAPGAVGDVELVLRSVARGLADETDAGNGVPEGGEGDEELFRDNQQRATGLVVTGDAGDARATEEAARAALAVLRENVDDPRAQADAIAALIEARTPANALWDALALHAVELLRRLSSRVVGVHAVTTLHGLRVTSERSTSPEQRALLLLQAAAWQGFVAKNGLERGRLDNADDVLGLVAPAGASLDDAFTKTGDAARAGSLHALAFARTDEAALIDRAFATLLRATKDEHEVKLTLALLDLADLSSPFARPLLLAHLPFASPGEPLFLPAWSDAATATLGA